MRIVIETRQDVFPMMAYDKEEHAVVLRVLVTDSAGRVARDYNMEQLMHNEFKSHFDIIWEAMGHKIKEQMKNDKRTNS